MDASVPGEATQLLAAWRSGDTSALNRLVGILYPQLRSVAHRAFRKQAGMHTLQTTGLVHEAFLKLSQSGGVTLHDRSHFLAVCAQVMRRILVDEARTRVSLKRGGGVAPVPYDENLHAAALEPAQLVQLNDALTALGNVDARKSKVIELRFFGGLSVEETAEALGISRETVLRDWRFGRAWLKSEMETAARHA
jgi:RNA polymerase sigma factor (TIGR02999 family)